MYKTDRKGLQWRSKNKVRDSVLSATGCRTRNPPTLHTNMLSRTKGCTTLTSCKDLLFQPHQQNTVQIPALGTASWRIPPNQGFIIEALHFIVLTCLGWECPLKEEKDATSIMTQWLLSAPKYDTNYWNRLWGNSLYGAGWPMVAWKDPSIFSHWAGKMRHSETTLFFSIQLQRRSCSVADMQVGGFYVRANRLKNACELAKACSHKQIEELCDPTLAIAKWHIVYCTTIGNLYLYNHTVVIGAVIEYLKYHRYFLNNPSL